MRAGERELQAGGQREVEVEIVDLTGGGYCGWNGAKKGDTCIWAPQNFNSGFAPDLAYVDP